MPFAMQLLKHSSANVCKAGFLFREKRILTTLYSLSDQDASVTHKELRKAPSTQNTCLQTYVLTETKMVCRSWPNSFTVTLIKNNDAKFHCSVNS